MHISSPMVSSPSASSPSSNFVSARMIPLVARVLGGVLVEGQRHVADALGQRAVADQRDRALEVDRLVVADIGLGGRGEQRLGQAV